MTDLIEKNHESRLSVFSLSLSLACQLNMRLESLDPVFCDSKSGVLRFFGQAF